MQSIFISYRRDDVPSTVYRMVDHLTRKYGVGRVFTDVNSIRIGVSWSDKLHEAIRSCRVVLVVIGPRWMDLLKERAKAPDYVVEEVAIALARVKGEAHGCQVVPVLVDGAIMPADSALPDTISPLAELTAATLRSADPHFADDIEKLIDYLAIRPPSRIGLWVRSLPLAAWLALGLTLVLGAMALFVLSQEKQLREERKRAQQETLEKQEFAAVARRGRLRPVRGGVSVGVGEHTGTICCVLKGDDGQLYLLSGHALASRDDDKAGAPVFQPGHVDRDRPDEDDKVAELTRWIKIKEGTEGNRAEGAIARIVWDEGEPRALPRIAGFGAVRGSGKVKKGDVVTIVGRTAAVSRAKVTDTDQKQLIELSMGGWAQFVGLIELELGIPQCQGAGNSGGPVLTSDGMLVGMILAATKDDPQKLPPQDQPKRSYAIPIEPILEELNSDAVRGAGPRVELLVDQ